MKKVILGIIVIVVAVLAISCGSNSSPKSIVKKYVTAIQKGDAESAADCFYYEGTDDEIAEQRETMVSLIEKSIKSLNKDGGIKSYQIKDVEQNGDKAIVYGKAVYGNGKVGEDEEIATVKVNGKWYIDLDK